MDLYRLVVFFRPWKKPGFGAWSMAALLFAIFLIFDFERFTSALTITNIIHHTAILGLIAIGQALVIMAREIDLSVGSVYGLAGIAFIHAEPALGPIGAFIAAVGLAAAIGWLNAFLTIGGKIASMIVTLCALFFYRGVILVWTGGSVRGFSQETRDHWFVGLFGGEWLGIENVVVWLLIALIGFHLCLFYSSFGNHLLACGGDPATANAQGVNVTRTKTTAFMLCSALAAIAGIATIADDPHTHVTMGQGKELEAIAAAVIGGCLLSGGRGSVVGAVLGALIIIATRFELIVLGAPGSWFITFVGILLIAAAIFNNVMRKWTEKL